jgi:hypothetical protein
MKVSGNQPTVPSSSLGQLVAAAGLAVSADQLRQMKAHVEDDGSVST